MACFTPWSPQKPTFQGCCAQSSENISAVSFLSSFLSSPFLHPALSDPPIPHPLRQSPPLGWTQALTSLSHPVGLAHPLSRSDLVQVSNLPLCSWWKKMPLLALICLIQCSEQSLRSRHHVQRTVICFSFSPLYYLVPPSSSADHRRSAQPHQREGVALGCLA